MTMSVCARVVFNITSYTYVHSCKPTSASGSINQDLLCTLFAKKFV